MIEMPEKNIHDVGDHDRVYRIGAKLALALAFVMLLCALPLLRGSAESAVELKAACAEIGGALMLDKFCVFPPI